ncbi:MAG TPA: C45 family autoproteolytic acyltransferase/hydrolase [Bryobacteraceae bacterium]|nr:C45 family autoproteolytic acyltransferase/hydrolase [Bryobacteraceae bacterium]
MRPIFFALAFVASLYAATPGSPLFHASFDSQRPAWTTLRGTAATDPGVTHDGQMSMRVESGPASENGARDARVQSAPIELTIGKSYELSGWIRTEKLAVRDLDRSPIATGAALTMASMPYDVQSESLAGTRDWTQVHLRFTATRAHDSIVLAIAYGGTFEGKAWFSGVSLNEAPADVLPAWPAAAAVTRYGPAYRYPVGGWIYLHIEGTPYERGYQHGRLMAREIPQYMERCAAELDPHNKEKSWDLARTTVGALFLHGFDQEILEEMRGIADGASDAGARWQGRTIDLTDIAVVNTTVELSDLNDALRVTPNGLEGLHLTAPDYGNRKTDRDHCSAFAATGPATRDGRMVIGHITWWPLTLAEQTNVMLDIQPTTGHRVLMQSYPGGIESGTDWYQNDAGVVLTETTINQSPFNIHGTPIAFRARHAIQYGDSIDKVVELLSTKNNGLYTNEWLLGDARTNEIALFELGTYKTRLYRSSKNDWFGGTEGFYWGDNNAKDLAVRLEESPDPASAPSYAPYVPTNRDLKWQDLYREYKGKIDEHFGFLAFHTAPLVSATAMDAKVTNADMASHMMLWAEFGRSNQTERLPAKGDREEFAGNQGLYPSGYRLISVRQPMPAPSAPLANRTWIEDPPHQVYTDHLWKGWVLPASPADNWFASGSAAYYEDLAYRDLPKAMAAHWAEFRDLSLTAANPRQQFELETDKGVLFLDQLRRNMGNDAFFKLMTAFFAAHEGQAVSAQAFLDAAGAKFAVPADPGGPMYTISDLRGRLGSALLVYGTMAEAGANRYAAEELQKRFYGALETQVPIRKDFELSAEDFRTHDVVFVGRPETNSALAAYDSKLGLDSSGALFRIDGLDHASGYEGLALAAANPLDHHHMVLVVAGNSPLETVLLTKAEFDNTQYAIFDSGKPMASGFLMHPPAVTAAEARR